MGKKLPDFTGMKIGKWTVLKKTGIRSWGTEYKCRCECGYERTIVATRLKNAVGCRHCATKLPEIPIGYQCNKWTVIEKSERGKQGIRYKCKCACGYVGYQTASDLYNKKSVQCKKCGCKNSIRKRTNIIGLLFGKWRVLEEIDKIWVKCECQCPQKTIALIKRTNLISHNYSMCKICHKINNSRKQWKGHGEISGHKWAVMKKGALSRDLEFNITREYVWELFKKQNRKCALTGIELKFRLPLIMAGTPDAQGEDTASLDRIDSSKGYTVDNIQWVHKDIQKMKMDFDQNYFIEMCKKITIRSNK